ncbi:GroES-like protein [Schizophyllum commune H4-8]|uniref:Enoyl reductase (ER) domain-containing protein n=1 Tax=Schizophyllum commune (strain H4-8 / FGSC 9210) TaxID=578458 RepID=D8QB71_SCHCM|nr:GroES-like protein [Schizophyllum commune H4-8]KAI5889058.1 GroES-like protein [Schizophyllum commune H4-8]
MSATALPESIKALRVLPDRKGLEVTTISWASQEKVKNLADNEIILRVHTVGLNPTDWKHAWGDWGTPGTIEGCDAAGDVVKVGAAVKHLKVGDRAAGFDFGGSWQTDNGSFAEYVRMNSAVVFKVPDGMTYEEAASFPIPNFTAAQALYIRLNLPKPFTSDAPFNEKILIWGGSTAVGHHAIQLAKLSGLTTFVTASPAVFPELKALGADQLFDYRDPDVVAKIVEAAGSDGIIYALDTVSENGTTDAVVDAMSVTRGGRVIALLPAGEATKNRRPDVRVELTLLYTALGYELTFAHTVRMPAMKGDEVQLLEWVSMYLPRMIEGWKTGEGAPTYKTQRRLRKLRGPLEDISKGLRIMSEGKYGREKLVHTIV